MKSMKLVLATLSVGACALVHAQGFPKVSDGLMTPQKLNEKYASSLKDETPAMISSMTPPGLPPFGALPAGALLKPTISPSIELPTQDPSQNYHYPNTIVEEKQLPEGPLLIARPINNQWAQQYYENNSFTPSIATRYPAQARINGESLQDPWILQLRAQAQAMGYSAEKINLEMSRQTPSQFQEWLKRVNN